MTVKRITDPLAIPVTGTDAHLPTLPAEWLRPQAVRSRLARAHLLPPEIVSDATRFNAVKQTTAAAVLVPLVQRADGLHVMLTQRTAHLRDHAGQISFPGGRSEPEDADAEATAVREAQEEVGLQPQWLEIIGRLPAYTTVTSYVVTPVVALVDPRAELVTDSFEVAEVFEVPLAFLMNPAHHQRHVFEMDGVQRQFLSMPWQARHREYFIWGATAAMLRNLYAALAAGGAPIITSR